jgi:hypothetical protein
MDSGWQGGSVAYCSNCGLVLREDYDDRANLERVVCPQCGMDPGDPEEPAKDATGYWMYAAGFKTSASVWYKPWTWGHVRWELMC